MATNLPLHPGAAAAVAAPDPARPAGPGQEIRERRDAIRRRIGPVTWFRATRPLLTEAARATLELTGTTLSHAEIAAVRKSGPAAHPAFTAPFAALAAIEQAARERDPTAPLLGTVHRIATSAPQESAFRSVQIQPQFDGASLSPPQAIPLRLGDLLGWISGKSGKDLETAPRAALFFARFLEISPFGQANFRVAHLMLSFFALADGQPPIWFEIGDAAGIREDVSRAFRFDTAPLTARIEAALRESLARIEAGLPT